MTASYYADGCEAGDASRTQTSAALISRADVIGDAVPLHLRTTLDAASGAA